jgi:hypothetical protein
MHFPSTKPSYAPSDSYRGYLEGLPHSRSTAKKTFTFLKYPEKIRYAISISKLYSSNNEYKINKLYNSISVSNCSSIRKAQTRNFTFTKYSETIGCSNPVTITVKALKICQAYDL